MTPGSDGPRGPRTAGPADTPATGYLEPLRTPWWWYPVALFIAAIIAGEFHVGGIDVTIWVPFATLLPLSVLIVYLLGRSRLEIGDGPDGEVRIRGAHIPLEFVSGSVGLDARTLRLVVGREGDPAAFVSIRPWIGSAVQLWLDDPDDPTPYWVVSTRHPERVVAIVNGR